MKLRPCRYCRLPILFAHVKKQDGTDGHVPLDPRAPIYRLTARPDGTMDASRVTSSDEMVSHFSTCTKLPGGRDRT